MGCTFTALVLRGRVAHLLHVGDTRAYRLSGDRLACLTTDHVRQDGAGRSHTLTRALGVETEVRLDYATQPVALHDRFLLCSDGVHGFLSGPEHRRDPARPLGSRGYRQRPGGGRARKPAAPTTAPPWFSTWSRCRRRGRPTSAPRIRQLPIMPVPVGGETIDGFVLKALISDGRYTPAVRRGGRSRGRHASP